MPHPPEFLTVLQFAAYLRVSPRTIYRLITAGLPSVLVGRSRRVPREQAIAWLGRQTSLRLR